MTCIVGIVDKKSNKVFIGADSAGVAGLSLSIRKDTKVFKNREFVIGCTSSFRMIQILRFCFVPPEIKKKDIYQYMCTDFIDTVRDCFKKQGYLKKDHEVESGGTFLVGYKERLFMIGSDFQVGENINGIISVGCGEDYAKAALFVLSKEKSKLTPKQKIIKSLQAAEFYSAGVSKPFKVIST